MAQRSADLKPVDPVWHRICNEANKAIVDEPLLGGLVHGSILHHETFEAALAYRIALKLGSGEMSEQLIRELADQAFNADPALGVAARADVMAVYPSPSALK